MLFKLVFDWLNKLVNSLDPFTAELLRFLYYCTSCWLNWVPGPTKLVLRYWLSYALGLAPDLGSCITILTPFLSSPAADEAKCFILVVSLIKSIWDSYCSPASSITLESVSKGIPSAYACNYLFICLKGDLWELRSIPLALNCPPLKSNTCYFLPPFF